MRYISLPCRFRLFRDRWVYSDGMLVALLAVVLLAAMPLHGDPTPEAFTGHYYEEGMTPKDWDSARVDAGTRLVGGESGHLATIADQRESAVVKALGGAAERWIGLTDSEATSTLDGFDLSTLGTLENRDTSGLPLPPVGMQPASDERGAGFQWITGEPLVIHDWRTGVPEDRFGADAVYMLSSGVWQDAAAGASVGQPGPFGPVLRKFVVEWDTELVLERFQVVERAAAPSWNGGTGQVSNLADAEALLALPAGHADLAREAHGEAYVICFQDPDLGGGLPHYVRTPYLLDVHSNNDDNFAWRATAWIEIPSAGDWTFAVAAGDAFRLEAGTNTFVSSGVQPTSPPRLTRSADGTLTVAAGGSGEAFYFPAAGLYPLTLTSFEAGFFAFIQLLAAAGAHAVFDAAQFDLVGDELNGGLALGPEPVPVALEVAPGPGGVGFRLSWDGVPGVVYRAQFSIDLIDWDDASEDVVGAAPLTQFDHVPGVSQGFYRIVQVD